MRTTINIEDSVYLAVRAYAEAQRKSLAEMVTQFLSESLKNHAANNKKNRVKVKNGIPLIPKKSGAKPVTLEFVNRLRDEE